MARFRRKASRRYRGFKRHSRRSGSKGGNLSLIELIGGMAAYSVIRPMAANAIPDGIAGLPAAYSDNLVLGGVGGLAAWKGSGMIKKAGTVVAAAETLIAVSKLSSGMGSSDGSNSGYL